MLRFHLPFFVGHVGKVVVDVHVLVDAFLSVQLVVFCLGGGLSQTYEAMQVMVHSEHTIIPAIGEMDCLVFAAKALNLCLGYPHIRPYNC